MRSASGAGQPARTHGFLLSRHRAGWLPAALRAALAVAVLSVLVSTPGAKAAPQDYCDGFPGAQTPSLTQPPFIKHDVPQPYDFIPTTVADFNDDGRPDLPWLENLGGFQFQFRPEIGNLMRSVLTDTVSPQTLHGIAVSDFDGDGLPDLVVAPYKSQWEHQNIPILTLQNLGNWNFELTNLPFLQNLLGYNPFQPWYSETIVTADLATDGTDDIFVPFYTWTNPSQSVFLHPTDSGLAEEAVARGLALQGVPPQFDAEGVQAVDINGDGYLDMYAAHKLLINDGTGRFTDHASDYGLPALGDEGVTFVDYDNDGLLDLYIRSQEPSQQLFRNAGNGTFVNVSVSSGLACVTENLGYFWGDAWADFDRNGTMDLLYAGTTDTGYQTALILNDGQGHFRLGALLGWFVNLAATADFDGDGDLDVAGENNISENVMVPPPNVYNLVVTPVDDNGIRNQQSSTVWVTSQCAGTPGIQTRVAGGNTSYLTQSDYSAHFALSRLCPYQVKVSFPRLAGQNPDIVTLPFSPPRATTTTELVVHRGGSVQAIDRSPHWYLPLIGR